MGEEEKLKVLSRDPKKVTTEKGGEVIVQTLTVGELIQAFEYIKKFQENESDALTVMREMSKVAALAIRKDAKWVLDNLTPAELHKIFMIVIHQNEFNKAQEAEKKNQK